MKKLKIAVIGVGNISESHIAGYKKNENVELYAFCDINEKTLKILKEKDAKIEKLKADKEKLVLANGNVLRQIPMGEEEMKESAKTEETSKPINLKDAFTGNGMFKH